MGRLCRNASRLQCRKIGGEAVTTSRTAKSTAKGSLEMTGPDLLGKVQLEGNTATTAWSRRSHGRRLGFGPSCSGAKTTRRADPLRQPRCRRGLRRFGFTKTGARATVAASSTNGWIVRHEQDRLLHAPHQRLQVGAAYIPATGGTRYGAPNGNDHAGWAAGLNLHHDRRCQRRGVRRPLRQVRRT